jgi:hypothetical protein
MALSQARSGSNWQALGTPLLVKGREVASSRCRDGVSYTAPSRARSSRHVGDYSTASRTSDIELVRPDFGQRRARVRGRSPLRTDTLELLNPLPAVFGHIDIPFGVHSDTVRLIELTREMPGSSETR